jgi:hypothetical protein
MLKFSLFWVLEEVNKRTVTMSGGAGGGVGVFLDEE